MLGFPRGPRFNIAVGSVVAVLVTTVMATSVAVSASDGLTPWASGPANGETVGDHPTIRTGELPRFVVGGFTPGSPVALRIACQTATASSVRADRQGIALVEYRVPRTVASGAHELLVTGPAALRTPAAKAARGNITAVVPRLAYFPFNVRGGGEAATKTRC